MNLLSDIFHYVWRNGFSLTCWISVSTVEIIWAKNAYGHFFFDLQTPESLYICLCARLVGVGSRCRGAASRRQASGIRPLGSKAAQFPQQVQYHHEAEPNICAPLYCLNTSNVQHRHFKIYESIHSFESLEEHHEAMSACDEQSEGAECPTVLVWSSGVSGSGEQPLCCTVSFKEDHYFTSHDKQTWGFIR